MKRFYSLALAALTTVSTISLFPHKADAAAEIYEFENGIITEVGDNTTSVIDFSGASGGKAVDLRDSGDTVTLNINQSDSGLYKLKIRYNQPYDENGKYQDIIVNGQNIGQIFCGYTGDNNFAEVRISASLRSGSNTVAVQGSWGWTNLDCLTVEGSGSSDISVSESFQILMHLHRHARCTAFSAILTAIMSYRVSRSLPGWAVKIMSLIL